MYSRSCDFISSCITCHNCFWVEKLNGWFLLKLCLYDKNYLHRLPKRETIHSRLCKCLWTDVSCWFALANGNSCLKFWLPDAKGHNYHQILWKQKEILPLVLVKKSRNQTTTKYSWTSDDASFCKPALTGKAAADTRPRGGLQYIPFLPWQTWPWLSWLE